MAENDWAQALSAAQVHSGVQVMFDSFGLTATLNPLSSEEMQECLDIGGQRGQKYALYLACPQLREAGRKLCDLGELIIPFDALERMSMGDVSAAYTIICQISGARGSVHIVDTGVENVDITQPLQRNTPEANRAASAPISGTEHAEYFSTSRAATQPESDARQSSAHTEAELGFNIAVSTQHASAEKLHTGAHSRPYAGSEIAAGKDINVDFIAEELCRRLTDAAGSM